MRGSTFIKIYVLVVQKLLLHIMTNIYNTTRFFLVVICHTNLFDVYINTLPYLTYPKTVLGNVFCNLLSTSPVLKIPSWQTSLDVQNHLTLTTAFNSWITPRLFSWTHKVAKSTVITTIVKVNCPCCIKSSFVTVAHHYRVKATAFKRLKKVLTIYALS